MPAPQQSVFLQARRPSCHPTNSVKALKAFGLVRGSNSKAYRRPGRAEILVPGSSRGDIDIGSCLQCCYTTVNSSWGPDTHRYLRDNHTTIAPPLVHRQVVMKSYIAGGCPRNFPSLPHLIRGSLCPSNSAYQNSTSIHSAIVRLAVVSNRQTDH